MEKIMEVVRAIIPHPELSSPYFLFAENAHTTTNNPKQITFLGGQIENNETREAALIREAEEETQRSINIIPKEFLFTVYRTTKTIVQTDFYWCVTHDINPIPDGIEIEKIYWANYKEILNLPLNKVAPETLSAIKIISAFK